MVALYQIHVQLKNEQQSSIYQLLPPVYKDLWIEWSTEKSRQEAQAKQEILDQAENVRKTFLDELIKESSKVFFVIMVSVKNEKVFLENCKTRKK